MPRPGSGKPLNFLMHDASRLIRAATNAGAAVQEVTVDPRSGKISVVLKDAHVAKEATGNTRP